MKLSERYPGAALITGASAGIGESFANALGKEGFDLVLVARREEKLNTLAARIKERYDIEVLVVAQDLTALDCADRIYERVAEKGWRVSFLVNNAGSGSMDPYTDVDDETHLRMVDLNCRAPVAMTNRFLPPMVDAANGAIIYLASTVAYVPVPYMSVYSATKAFNLFLSESLFPECRKRGVDVLSLAPGYTETEFAEVADMDASVPRIVTATPDAVVRHSLKAIGRRPATVHGLGNWLMTFFTRFVPRRLVPWISGKVVCRSSPKLKVASK